MPPRAFHTSCQLPHPVNYSLHWAPCDRPSQFNKHLPGQRQHQLTHTSGTGCLECPCWPSLYHNRTLSGWERALVQAVLPWPVQGITSGKWKPLS